MSNLEHGTNNLKPLGGYCFRFEFLGLIVGAKGIDELIKIAWPTTLVEEDNLKVQIATIRKILGDDSDSPQFITNIIGSGGWLFLRP